jgi:DNA (cytosine-5)-methyltransferase 1
VLTRDGNTRINPAFSEWMLGWPAGWVTDPAIGISRGDQLRIIGNGVVPACASAALSWLLGVSVVEEVTQ